MLLQWAYVPLNYAYEKIDSLIPTNLIQALSKL